MKKLMAAEEKRKKELEAQSSNQFGVNAFGQPIGGQQTKPVRNLGVFGSRVKKQDNKDQKNDEGDEKKTGDADQILGKRDPGDKDEGQGGEGADGGVSQKHLKDK